MESANGSGNGLLHVRRQTITRTNDAILSIGPLGASFSEIRIKTQNILFMMIHFRMSSVKYPHFVQEEMS